MAKLLVILVFLLALGSSAEAIFVFDGLIRWFNQLRGYSFYDFANSVLDPATSLLLDEGRSNENGTRDEFRDFLLHDMSNEGLEQATAQQLITRAGFSYRNHYVLSDDGYITQLIRIINPKADPRRMKQPPVMLTHGGIIDQNSWIWASNRQTFPQRYPRSIWFDGPIRSSNRSLAFVLANNGYDVWLVGTRGSNRQNQGFVNPQRFGRDIREAQMMRPGKVFSKLRASDYDYWMYSMDEIVMFELPRQIDKILTLTGSTKLSLVTISYGSMLSMSLMASNRRFADKIHVHVQMLPIINNKGTNNLLGFMHGLFPYLPDGLGTMMVTFSMPLTRAWLTTMSKLRWLRYTLVWTLTVAFNGPSPTFQTNLESPVIGHVFQQTSFVEIKHWTQQLEAAQLQRFDYGPAYNWRIYGNSKPPKHDLKRIGSAKWMLLSGGNDKLATMSSVRQVIRQASQPPEVHVFNPSYNHLDHIAGQDNDVRVNLPVLSFLDRHQLQTRNIPAKFTLMKAHEMDRILESFVPLA